MVKNTNNSDMNHEDPEKINFQELMDFYKYKGWIGSIKLKKKIFKNMILQSMAERALTPNIAVTFQKWKGVNIGKHVYIGPKTFIDILYPQLITIEDYVSIGYSMIFAHANPTYSIDIKNNYYSRKVAPITIKKGAWIAAGCIILPGVTIGENSIVGAGSVVTKDVESYSLFAGSPAKKIKNIKFKTSDKQV